jgi:protein-L-isoaspartate O-methyltransferase
VRVKAVQIDDETRAVFLRSRIEGNNLFLADQLPRELYAKVAKAIKAAGGKWHRQSGAHVFAGPVLQTLNVTAETVSVVNVQQTYQAFWTPPEVAYDMAEAAELYVREPNMTVLEPSAGIGRLVEAAGMATDWSIRLTAVEINEIHAKKLMDSYSGTRANLMVIQGDFMAQNGALGLFDRILMNPPFTGGQDIAHIKRAMAYLAPGGRLVALCADGPKQREALQPLAYAWSSLPARSFHESGTDIAIAMLTIMGPKEKERAPRPEARRPVAPAVPTFYRGNQIEFAL